MGFLFLFLNPEQTEENNGSPLFNFFHGPHLCIRNSFEFYQVKIALIGIRAGSSGLHLTSADNVVFLELPLTPGDIQQVPLILCFLLVSEFEAPGSLFWLPMLIDKPDLANT